MTDVKLLPSSVAAFTEALHGDRGSLDAWLEVHDEREVRAHVEAYARANIGVATAARDAEIEALRAEVGELHMHAKRRDQYAVEKAAQALDWKKRAERLAEALRLALKWAEAPPTGEPLYKESEADLAAARAALRDHDQEDRNG